MYPGDSHYMKCKRCYVDKPIEEFTNSYGKVNVACNNCRQTANEYNRVIREGGIGNRQKFKNLRIAAIKRGNFICATCKDEKPIEQFYKIEKGHAEYFGLSCSCRTCSLIRGRKSKIKKRYNLTEQEHIALYNSQEGKCAICDTPIKFESNKEDRNSIGNVDHCHITGKVRGMLCNDCNRGMGFLKDDPEIVMKVYKYLTNGI